MADIIIRNGMIYDGSGEAGFQGDVAITGDKIEVIGRILESARLEIDAAGLAVAPGFINMMCWANESLIEDGRSQSDIRQGVTLEVLGEGWSMGPLNDRMKAQMKAADRSGARFAIILGDDELAAGEAQVRDLQASDQRAVPISDLARALRA